MIREFTYFAPINYLDTTGTSLKEVTTNYRGADEVWIFINKETRNNARFMSEGDLPDPEMFRNEISFKLMSTNPNHIILMDMLSSSKGHVDTGNVTEVLSAPGAISAAPEFSFSYTCPLHQNTLHTYAIADSVVGEDGVVMYHWKPPHITWEESEPTVRMRRIEAENKLTDPIVMEIPSLLARYTRFIAVLKFIEENFVGKVGSWKVNIPLIHEV